MIEEENAQIYPLSKTLKSFSYWGLYLIPLLLMIILCVGWVWGERHGAWTAPKPKTYDVEAFNSRQPVRFSGSYTRDFNDLNDVQLKVAKKIGIEPIETREAFDRVKSDMVLILSCKYYTVDKLTHSVPYLIPLADDLLTDVCKGFHDYLESHHLPLYRPIVTSLTRTLNDVKRLRRGNVNASRNSTHMYGTTFDISWRRFEKVDPNDPRTLTPQELKHIFAIVIQKLHHQKRCFIKHERRQACFHFTVRP